MPESVSTCSAYKMLTCIYLCRTLLFFAPYADFSMENPLFIDITLSDDYITVRNLKSSLLSKMESTGLGHKNIIERYSLLCDKKVKIENAENFYSVSLPIIKKQSL